MMHKSQLSLQQIYKMTGNAVVKIPIDIELFRISDEFHNIKLRGENPMVYYR